MISVILPTHNRAGLLKDAIESVLDQTYKDLELIIIDDGSTDHTEQVARRYGSLVRYMKQAQGGPAKARNMGIKHAKGEYIAFIDDDDIYNPDKLSMQLDCFNFRPQIGFVFSDMTALAPDGTLHGNYMRIYFGVLDRLNLSFGEVFPNAELLGSFIQKISDPSLKEEKFYWGNIFRFLLLGNFVLQSTFMARKSALMSVGGYREDFEIAEDADLYLRMSQHWEGGFLAIPTIQYRLTPASISRSKEFYLKLWINTLQSLSEVLEKETSWNYKEDRDIARRLSFIHHKIAFFQAKGGDLRSAYPHWLQSIKLNPSDGFGYFGLSFGWLLPMLTRGRMITRKILERRP